MPANTDSHVCNLCGLPCVPNDEFGEQGLLDARVCGGYRSTPGNGRGALDDTVEYRFSLCEFCLDWLFGKFRLPVAVRDYMTGEQLRPWRPAAQRVVEDDWRRMKDEFMVEHERRREAREHRPNRKGD